jgi:two-component system NtrC family response regulator
MDDVKPEVLIVEDNKAIARQLRWTLSDFLVSTAGDREGALQEAKTKRFPVVLLDLGLPPEPEGVSEGLATLQDLLALNPLTKVIVVTGREGKEHALKAVGLGAYDFYRKPADAEEIRILVKRALNLYRLEAENRRLARARRREPLPGIISASEAMVRACRLVERAANSDISVLFTGESGTGKELLARALHAASPRAAGPFVAINCSSIPEQLLESELFGHERGAFTGAVRQSIGYIEVAQGGTLFLDEIGDLPLALQPKLLRFLEERQIQRVGGRKSIRIDVRIVSATHRNLEQLIEAGQFREDLYYRLRELAIESPPLRERPEDAVLLAHHFFERFRSEGNKPLRGLAPDLLSAVENHAWPGNVRELENRMRRAALLAEGAWLTARDLDLSGSEPRESIPSKLRDSVREAEERAVTRAWAAARGNVSKAGEILGVSRPTVYKLLREYGLKK